MANIESNGITLEYEIEGSGPPILLVMGLGGQLVDWPPGFVERLVAAGHTVVRHDNRDIGLSSETDWTPPPLRRQLAAAVLRRPLRGAGYTVVDMAADAAALIDGLQLGPTHVVGVSMGGMIVQQLAIDRPDLVASLCSIMSNTGDRRHGTPDPRLLVRMARLGTPTLDTAVERSVEIFSLISGDHFDPVVHRERAEVAVERSFRPEGVLRQQAAIAASPDRTPGLRRVTAPTLVIHGLQDRLVRPDGGIATCRAVPGSRLVMFPDMGHDLPEPRWDEMVELITRNAARAPAPAGRTG